MTSQNLSFNSAGWLPVSLAALLASGILVSYVWAVVRKDVPNLLPFISSAGGNPPQSGVFSIFLFLAVTTGILTVVVRHMSLHQDTSSLELKHLRRLNHLGLFLGLLCLLGMILVAAYPVRSWKLLDVNQTLTQENKQQWRKCVLMPHSMGAGICFAVGLVYAICQAIISLLMRPVLAPCFCWKINHFQLFAARVIACIVAFVSLGIMYVMDDKTHDVFEDTPSSKHRALAEWILALSLVLLFLTFYPEMKPIQLEFSVKSPPHGRTESSTNIPESGII